MAASLLSCIPLLLATLAQDPSAGKEPGKKPQEPPAKEEIEVTVTAVRRPSPVFATPRSVNVVDEETLRRRNLVVALDALQQEMGVWIEHRTATTGDLVMRGLSGANILALIDGDTLSTFWGEGGFAGDDMYGKVDPFSIERIEVVRGPASVLYGSNALGGVIQFFTRRPPLDYTDGGTAWGGELRTFYGVNGNQRRGRMDLWGANEWLRWRVGGTLGRYDDYEGGAGVGTVAHTGGKEGNLDWNSEFRLSAEETLELNVQKVHRDPVYRHYRPTQTNSNDRLGIHLALNSVRPTVLWDEASIRVYRQYKEDWRFWTPADPNAGQKGVARWLTWQVSPQATLELGDHLLTYGLAFQLDRGESPDDEQFTLYPPGGGPKQKGAPDSDWWNWGAYVQDEWALHEDWTLLGAARFDWFLFRATPDRYYQPAAGDPTADDIRSTERALTGGLALTRHLGSSLNVYASWFRGFRQFAPNFGFRQLGNGILVPNGLLEPVISDTWELGAKVEEDGLHANAAFYYTDFDNFQNRVPGSYGGASFYDFNGNGVFEPNERVIVTTANGEAFIRGLELWSSLRLDRVLGAGGGRDWTVGLGYMWNFGKDQTNEEELRHTTPSRLLLTVDWAPQGSPNRPWLRLEGDFVDAFDRVSQDRLNSDVGYRKDPADPTSPILNPYGLPGYAVINLRGGWTFQNGVELVASLENLLNKNYRSAHSRADAPGIQLFLGITVPL